MAEPVAVPLAVAPAAAGPQARLLARTIYPGAPAPGGLALDLGDKDLLPDTGEVVFSIEAAAPLRSGYAVEIAARDAEPVATLTAGKGLVPESARVLVATLRAQDLPPGTFGPLRFRLVQPGDAPGARAGDWQPLATLVRLPEIERLDCPEPATGTGASASACTLTGRKLFLLDATGADPALAGARSVPSGFTGRALEVPGAAGQPLYLRLRDAPGSVIALRPR